MFKPKAIALKRTVPFLFVLIDKLSFKNFCYYKTHVKRLAFTSGVYKNPSFLRWAGR